MLIVSQIKQKVVYETVQNSRSANIIAIGTIGTGKSTLLNKLIHFAQFGDKIHENKLIRAFEAGENTTGLTTSINVKHIKSQDNQMWNLVDTPGHSDPNLDTMDNWN